MHHGGSIARGYPSKVFYFSSGNNHYEDFERDIDITIGRVMDTIINDLPEKERAAINFKYLGQKYNYDSIGYNYCNTLAHAMELLKVKAEEKGLIN